MYNFRCIIVLQFLFLLCYYTKLHLLIYGFSIMEVRGQGHHASSVGFQQVVCMYKYVT